MVMFKLPTIEEIKATVDSTEDITALRAMIRAVLNEVESETTSSGTAGTAGDYGYTDFDAGKDSAYDNVHYIMSGFVSDH